MLISYNFSLTYPALPSTIRMGERIESAKPIVDMVVSAYIVLIPSTIDKFKQHVPFSYKKCVYAKVHNLQP